MFESEGDKKKKVYPRLPNVWGKKDTPYYIYEGYMSDCLLYNLHGIVSTLQDKQAIARDIVLLELGGLHLTYQLAFGIIYIGIWRSFASIIKQRIYTGSSMPICIRHSS